MNKSDTVAYGVLSEDGQERRLTEEQLAFLVGREQIINVTAQLYKDRVIFRGKDCSISEMPVIQVNKQYNELLKNKQNNINTSNKNTSSINTSNKNISNKNTSNNILDKLVRYLNSSSFVRISNNINYTMTKLSNNEYKFEVRYRLTALESDITVRLSYKDGHYIIYDKNSNKFNKINIVSKDPKLIINILASIIGLRQSDTKIRNIANYMSYIEHAFETYSETVSYINDVLDGNKTDDENYCTSMLYAVIMTILFKDKTEGKINSILFRGEKLNKASYINKNFTSASYSIYVAASFAFNHEFSRILVFTDIESVDCMDIIHASIYEEEFEVLIRANNIISIQKQIGYFMGQPVYIAKYAKQTNNRIEEIKRVVTQYISVYKTLSVYAMAVIINNINCIKDVNDISYEGTLTFYTYDNTEIKFKAEKDGSVTINNNRLYTVDEVNKELQFGDNKQLFSLDKIENYYRSVVYK